MKYDIFISYRREGGDKYARTIQQALEKQYRVFLDFDELKDGAFDQRIIDAISESPVFLLILSKGALDRCVNEDDWVRQEIMQAIKSGCHIVPVTIVEDNFEGIPSDLPKDLQHAVGQHQFSELQMKTLFKESMEKLIKTRIAPYIHKEQTDIGAEVHIETDADCQLLHFKKVLAHIHKNEDNVVHLKRGKHKLEFVSMEYEEIKVQRILEIPEEDYIDFIEVEIKDIIETRRKTRKYAKHEIGNVQINQNQHKENLLGNQNGNEAASSNERTFIVNGVYFKMLHVEGGRFMMGSKSALVQEMPVHEVRLDSFYIGQTSVTQELWEAVMGFNKSNWKGLKLPAENISWKDCQSFIKKLNQITNLEFRLPTEAEWEFAARGGNKSQGYKYSGSNNIDEVAWYGSNSDSFTHEVAIKAANELGLFDMSGNVWEWCQDKYSKNYYESSPINNPQGPKSGPNRVLRGGGLSSSESSCRVTYRNDTSPTYYSYDMGFRLVL